MINNFRVFDEKTKTFSGFKFSEENETFQATGILDKDDRPIFEGDYLMLENFDVDYSVELEDYIDVDEVREVVFDDGCFKVVCLWDSNINCNIDMINPDLTRIVGNVKKTPLTSERISEL